MADSDLTALAGFTPILTDIVYGVDDPGGTPVPGKLTLTQINTLLGANIAIGTARVTSGTFADARIAESNVTQYVDAVKALLGDLADLDEVTVALIDATGTPDATTYLRGDGTWETPEAGGDGITNLAYTASPTNGTVTSDTGTDATVPLATGTDAGLMAPTQFTKLADIDTAATDDQTGEEIVAAIDAELGGVGWQGGAGTGAAVYDEGVLINATPTSIDFVGAGVSVTDAGGGLVEVEIAGGGALGNPGADRGVFWDDSAETTAYFTATGGLEFSGTDLQIATSPTITTPTLTLKSGTAPTGEGVIEWHAADNMILMGTGAVTQRIPSTAHFSGDATVSTTAVVTLKANSKLSALEFVIDGGSSAITTGVKGYLQVPFACTITAVRLLANASGSIVVDIWKDTYANFPPVDADSITASAVPTISGATKAENTTLTGWTTSVAAGDILGFNVDSATTVTRVTVVLVVTIT